NTAAVLMPLFSVALIDAELLAGHVEAAAIRLEQATRQKREPVWAPLILLARGELQLAQNPEAAAAAEELYGDAIALARSRAAKSIELRAALSLARLYERQGRRRDAVDLLQPVYSWFSEGFETGDLKDAKALLDRTG